GAARCRIAGRGCAGGGGPKAGATRAVWLRGRSNPSGPRRSGPAADEDRACPDPTPSEPRAPYGVWSEPEIWGIPSTAFIRDDGPMLESLLDTSHRLGRRRFELDQDQAPYAAALSELAARDSVKLMVPGHGG